MTGQNVTEGKYVTLVGLPNLHGGELFNRYILPQTRVQKGSSGVDKQSVHLEAKCHSGHSET
jgi:hypothetical protein